MERLQPTLPICPAPPLVNSGWGEGVWAAAPAAAAAVAVASGGKENGGGMGREGGLLVCGTLGAGRGKSSREDGWLEWRDMPACA